MGGDQGRQSLTPINPRTGKPVPEPNPHNRYFMPDSHSTLVVAENEARQIFLSARGMRSQFELKVPCRGVNHLDFSPDGQHLLAACKFSGDLIKVDLLTRRVTGVMHAGGMLRDVSIVPDGSVYSVADTLENGVRVIDGSGLTPRKVGFIPTGRGTHGLYPSRDGTRLFIPNRGEGTVSVLDFASRHLIARWIIPGGGSPHIGSVSVDGRQL